MKKTTKILALAFIAMTFVLSGCQMSPELIVNNCTQDIDKAELEKKDLSGKWERTTSTSSKDKEGHESYDTSKETVTLTKEDNTKYKVTLKKGATFSSEGKRYLSEVQKKYYTDEKIKELIKDEKNKLEEDYDNVKVSMKVDKNDYLVYKVSGKAKDDKDWGYFYTAALTSGSVKTNAKMTAFASETSVDVAGYSEKVIFTYVKK